MTNISSIGHAINFTHLDQLSTIKTWSGEPVLLTHIYAEPPSYAPVDAPGEGIAAVDDIARAAIAYLDEHRRTGDGHAMQQGRAALDFTMHMQQPNGSFANFVTDERGTINLTGPTSKPGMGWWTMRGMWALARGYREFAGTDPAYARRLLAAYELSEGALRKQLGAGNVTPAATSASSPSPPAWLKQLPPDQASVGALALAEMQEAHPNSTTRAALTQIADGLLTMQGPQGARGAINFMPEATWSPGTWHAWGAHAGEALARAGQVLHRDDLVSAAKIEIDGVFGWELAAGQVHELTPLPVRDGQQAYGISAATRAAMAVYRASGDVSYARLAGLQASWLFGDNMAGEPMYDAATGRTYDGIDGAARGVNHASGAESTIEGLMTLQAIAGVPEAERFARMLPDANRSTTWTSIVASNFRDLATGNTLTTVPVVSSPEKNASRIDVAQLAPGRSASTTIDLPSAGSYVVLAGRIRGEINGSDGKSTQLDVCVDGLPAGTLGGTASGVGEAALDLLRGAPIQLGAGTHKVTLTVHGATSGSPVLLQGLVLHPVIARTELHSPDGADKVSVAYDLAHRHLQISG